MIILLEPICSAWTHEEGNAGFLQQVRSNSDDEVLYIGEEKHIRCIRKIYNDSQIRFATINRMVDFDKADDYGNVFYYFELLWDILIKYKPNILFILCGYRPCILTAELIAVLFPKIKFNFLIHGMVEEKKGKRDSYAKLFRLSRLCANLRFVSYSPYCTGEYWKVNKNKFVFFHHPYVMNHQNIPISGKERSGKTIIGIIGACANDKAVKVISMVNQRKPKGEYEFWVASKFGNKFKDLPNVKVMNLEFDQKSKEKFMQDMDYLLLPYGRDEYTVSVSGVLWDAIANKVPCLMLDCRYFTYYLPYKIGYQADSMNKLCELICEKIQCKERDTFFVGLNKIDEKRTEAIRLLLQ